MKSLLPDALTRCVESCCESMLGCEAAQLLHDFCSHYQCRFTNSCNVQMATETQMENIHASVSSSSSASFIVFVVPPNEGRLKSVSHRIETVGGTSVLSEKTILSTLSPDKIRKVMTPAPITANAPVNLTVSVGENRIIQLPQNSIVINAFVVPSANDYKYQWTTLNSQPGSGQDIGTMQDQNTASLKLSSLKAGLYSFKLSVNGSDSYGEAFVNITVLPPKRVNKLPVVVIQPNNPVVKLPTNETILDGSQSIDDDRIVAYHWEPIQVPIGYQIPADVDLNTATLQLRNLIAGTYLFNLTLQDSDNATSSGWANVTVLKEIDYPPTALAGPNVIIHLPQNEVYLNGNSSTDDKGIVSWLWTRSQDEEDPLHAKPVDMDGTTTPILRLSKLGVGVYKFVLKVTDTSNQTSTAETHVFVKPEEITKPQADAGPAKQLSMPFEHDLWLNGSASRDGSFSGIVNWNWTQLSGPRLCHIHNSSAAITKVTGLIPGLYTFNLTVTNSKHMSDWATVNVTITQSRNAPPVALISPDQTITCPCDLVEIDGSESYDDIDIVEYRWSREPDSLAAGTIVNASHLQPILKLIELVPGRYRFRLTVVDSQGAVGSNVTSLQVIESQHRQQQVELLLNTDVRSFKVQQLGLLLKRLEILLSSSVQSQQTRIAQIELYPEFRNKKVVLVFEVLVNNRSLAASEVVRRLRDKIRQDRSLLVPEVLQVNPVKCQTDCSKHGHCDPYTKQCVCDPFWMQNFVRIRLGDQESNCDWSVLYFVLIFCIIFISICSVFWCLIGLLFNAVRLTVANQTMTQHLRRNGGLDNARSVRYLRKSKKSLTNKKLKSLKYTLLESGGEPNEMEESSDDPTDGLAEPVGSLSFIRRHEVKQREDRQLVRRVEEAVDNAEYLRDNDLLGSFEALSPSNPSSIALNHFKRSQSNGTSIDNQRDIDLFSSDSDVTIFDSAHQNQNKRKTNDRRVHWQ